MIDPIILKSLIGIGILGSACGVAFLFYGRTNPKDIREYLINAHGAQILNTEGSEDDSDWDNKVNLGKTIFDAIKDVLGESSGFEMVEDEDIKDKLKKKCKELLNKPMTDSTYNDRMFSRIWCTRNPGQGNIPH